jgi:hypothetical protein
MEYIATSGSVIIKAGETQTTVGVEIIGDSISENDIEF